MEALTSAISVQVDTHDKEIANSILKNLGLNMSTFVNMAIKQLIYRDGLPFEVKNPKPSRELLEALQEGEDILNPNPLISPSELMQFVHHSFRNLSWLCSIKFC